MWEYMGNFVDSKISRQAFGSNDYFETNVAQILRASYVIQ